MKELSSKTELKKVLGGTVLAVAATGVSAAKPLWAGGYAHAPCNVPSQDAYFLVPSRPFAEDMESRFKRAFERFRKEPFDHYAHNPDDLQHRPICPPYCPPDYGYVEPRWRQLDCPDGASSYTTYPPPLSQPTIAPTPPPAPAAVHSAPSPRELPADVDEFPLVAPPRDETLSQTPEINPGPSLWRPSDGWTAHRPDS